MYSFDKTLRVDNDRAIGDDGRAGSGPQARHRQMDAEREDISGDFIERGREDMSKKKTAKRFRST
jgi:hypothetical protein